MNNFPIKLYKEKVFCLALFFVFNGSASLAAQQPGKPELAEIDFTVCAVGAGTWTGIYYNAAADQPMELEFRQFARSQVYHYSGPSPLVFVRKSAGEAEKTVFEPAAKIELPALTGKFLFFLQQPKTNIPGQKDERQLKVVAMDDSLAGMPAGSLVFFNATGVPLLGMLGEKKLDFPPGVTGPFEVENSGAEKMPVRLVVRYADSYKIVLQNRWSFSAGNRTIVLLLPPKVPGSFRLQSYRISEYVPPPPVVPADGNKSAEAPPDQPVK